MGIFVGDNDEQGNPENYPAMQIASIPTEERHYAGFAPRAIETPVITSVRPHQKGFIASGVQIQETFELVNPVVFPDGVLINVTGIKEMLAARYQHFRMLRATLNERWIEYITRTSDVEERRIAQLTDADLERPGILVVWTIDMANTTVVDGAHRMVARWRKGLKTMELALVMWPSIKHLVRPRNGATR